MGLFIRELNEVDYEEILTGWWEQWGWTPPSKDFLPNDGKGGIMVYDDEVPVCAGFMYLTNSKVSWVDWVISNKEYKDREKRKEALKLLVLTLTSICKRAGSLYVYALIKNESLIGTYEELGYVRGDSYTSEMIKTL